MWNDFLKKLITNYKRDKRDIMNKSVSIESLPSALDEFKNIKNKINSNEPIFFLDYDGTLTPIVSHPEDANLSNAMRETIDDLAKQCIVVIISGRGLTDLQQRVGLSNVYYVGSHGFEILGPNNLKNELPEAKALLPELEKAEQILKEKIQFKGSQIERKHFSIAVHYRNVDQEEQDQLVQSVKNIGNDFEDLKTSYGKKVIELRPALDWHKGKALLWLLENIPLTRKKRFSIYIGDDLTDEDAFNVLEENGLGIVVQDPQEKDRSSRANYALSNPEAVQTFLQKFIKEKINE